MDHFFCVYYAIALFSQVDVCHLYLLYLYVILLASVVSPTKVQLRVVFANSLACTFLR